MWLSNVATNDPNIDMKKLSALFALAVFATSTQAQDDRPYWYGVPAAGYEQPTAPQAPAEQPMLEQPPLEDYSENPIYPKGDIVDPGCPCFSGKWELGVFAAALFPDSDQSNTMDLGDSAGAGLTVGYWFNEQIGLEYSGAWYGTQPEIHNSALDLVFRWPNLFSCLSPYVFGGGGVHTDGSTVGLYRVGGGLDIRFESWSCIGLFIDGTYTWTEDDVQDYAIGRIGMRIPF